MYSLLILLPVKIYLTFIGSHVLMDENCDLEFSQYISELDTPQLDGYEFFTKCDTVGYSFEIYRKYAEVPSYRCY